jgi:PAS domain S-box-containing protein
MVRLRRIAIGRIQRIKANIIAGNESTRMSNSAYTGDSMDGSAVMSALVRDLSKLMEQMSDGVLVVIDGTIAHANTPLAKMLGLGSRDSLMGTQILRWVDPVDHVAWKAHIAGESETTEIRMVRSNGEIVHVELSPARPMSLDGDARFMIAHDVTERHRIEQRILDMTVRERRRIAYDLHDGLGQCLTAVALHMRLIRQCVEEGHLPDIADLDSLAKLIQESIEQARRMAKGLDVFATSDESLTAALRNLAAGAETIFPLSCRVTGHNLQLRHQDRRSTQLYRITQEAVNNAVRHGDASEVVIDLALRDGQLRLSITDNGRGLKFPIDTKGMGLRIMQHRAELAGGHLEIGAVEEGGTRILCVVPGEGVSFLDH